jgi:hypothetical protein
MRVIEIVEDVIRRYCQVIESRKMKWLGYIEYMEDRRPGT